jgi:ABC-2 type transport system permease protein
MNKVFAVIRREFVERVRTRAFVIATVLFPVFIIGMMFLPALLLTRTSGAKRIAVIDAAQGDLGARVEAALAAATRGDGPEAMPLYDPVLVMAGDRLLEVQDSLIPYTGLSKRKAAESPESFDGLLLVTEDAVLTGSITYLAAGNAGAAARPLGATRTGRRRPRRRDPRDGPGEHDHQEGGGREVDGGER